MATRITRAQLAEKVLAGRVVLVEALPERHYVAPRGVTRASRSLSTCLPQPLTRASANPRDRAALR